MPENIGFASGYNPIRHNCPKEGCYLLEHHPRAEWFAGLFPGKISFSDMDRIVEIGGRALVLEWKGSGAIITKGQEIMWQRLTRGGMMTVVAVQGNPKSMEVRAMRICFQGKWNAEWFDAGTVDLADFIKSWAEWAQKNRVSSVSVVSMSVVGAASK